MKIGLQRTKQENSYFVSLSNFLYPSHSLQTGLPMYFGLPSLIFRVPGTTLQIQQTTMRTVRICN